MIGLYADVVFGHCEHWVPVRALAEKGGADRPPHTPFIEADRNLAAKLETQALWAADAGMALFVVPGTVLHPGEAKAGDVVQTQVSWSTSTMATLPQSAIIWPGIWESQPLKSHLAASPQMASASCISTGS